MPPRKKIDQFKINRIAQLRADYSRTFQEMKKHATNSAEYSRLWNELSKISRQLTIVK